MNKKKSLTGLLDATDAWCEADECVADGSRKHENEEARDAAKDRMISLAKSFREGASDENSCVGWCYLCDDSENLENVAYPRFFRTLAEAKKELRNGYREDCKMFGRDDLNKKETWIAKDGLSAQLLTIVDMRLIHYSITKIVFV